MQEQKALTDVQEPLILLDRIYDHFRNSARLKMDPERKHAGKELAISIEYLIREGESPDAEEKERCRTAAILCAWCAYARLYPGTTFEYYDFPYTKENSFSRRREALHMPLRLPAEMSTNQVHTYGIAFFGTRRSGKRKSMGEVRKISKEEYDALRKTRSSPGVYRSHH